MSDWKTRGEAAAKDAEHIAGKVEKETVGIATKLGRLIKSAPAKWVGLGAIVFLLLWLIF